jgi:hypothetical protein
MALVLSGSTSGTITLDTAAVAGSNTITLPASTGTVVTSNAPASGNVIQVVQGVSTTENTTNSQSYVNTSLTASITPKFSTSKILVLINGSFGFTSAGTAGYNYYFGITRNSTLVYDGQGMINTGVNQLWMPGAIGYLDSPSTTSSTTYYLSYKIQPSGAGNARFNNGQITLLEVAA